MIELRIGDVATMTGTTPRTIRYYEEIGLLETAAREAGKHRTYTESDVERLQELLRLKQLLNVSLDELKVLADAESARAALRAEWQEIEDPERRREIALEAISLLDRQLVLVRRRLEELGGLEASLAQRRARLEEILDPAPQPSR